MGLRTRINWETTRWALLNLWLRQILLRENRVGLILESAVSDSHVGSKDHDGKQYFQALLETGYFVRRYHMILLKKLNMILMNIEKLNNCPSIRTHL